MFISQLHRRARLINPKFQQRVATVVWRHSSPPSGWLDGERTDSASDSCNFGWSPSRSQLPPRLAQAVRQMRRVAYPSPEEQAKCSLECEFADGKHATVEVRAAPIKTVMRMREKLAE